MLWLSIVSDMPSSWPLGSCRGVTALQCRRALSGFARRSASQIARVQGFTALPLSIPHALAPVGALQLVAACIDEGHRDLLIMSLLFHCSQGVPPGAYKDRSPSGSPAPVPLTAFGDCGLV